MRLRLVTPPASEPVSLDEAKAHLRLESTDDDTYVTTLIQAARQHVESVCERGLLSQTWEAILPGFPRWEMELPQGQLVSVASITYVDDAGATQTVDPTTYETDTASVPGRLVLAYGKSWPAIGLPFWSSRPGFWSSGYDKPNRVRSDCAPADLWALQYGQSMRRWDAVRVRYTVGWATAADVPAPIRQALLLLVAQMYEFRTPEVDRTLSKVSFTVDALLSPYRLVHL